MRWIIGIILLVLGILVAIGSISNAAREKDTVKRKSANNGIVAGVVLAIIGFFVIPHGGSSAQPTATSSASNSSAPSSGQSQTVEAGQNAIIKPSEGTWVATSKANEDQLLTFVNAKNEQAIQDMINNGNVLTLPHGTHVVVLDMSWSGAAHVKIYDSPWTDQEGYVPIELLAPDTSK